MPHFIHISKERVQPISCSVRMLIQFYNMENRMTITSASVEVSVKENMFPHVLLSCEICC